MTELVKLGDHMGAVFSPCRAYRYSLWRTWDDGPRVAFIGLNPSTADETSDDPTIRRCIGFAKDWGYSGLIMLNLFAWRATDPADMKAALEPVGPENDRTIKRVAASVDELIAAWGVHGAFKGRGLEVLAMFAGGVKLKCLGKTKDGHPKHPLYLPKTAERRRP